MLFWELTEEVERAAAFDEVDEDCDDDVAGVEDVTLGKESEDSVDVRIIVLGPTEEEPSLEADAVMTEVKTAVVDCSVGVSVDVCSEVDVTAAWDVDAC